MRRRRIDEAEEAALLSAAPSHIQAMIVAAIDTGMRQGEMLALRFGDVDLERGLITLRGETTKSRKMRVVPISTERLRAVIEWLRLDGDGRQAGGSARLQQRPESRSASSTAPGCRSSSGPTA
jgi:integrase